MNMRMPQQTYGTISKKKVLFLSRLFWPHVGGVETHVTRLSEELMKREYEITVMTEQHDKDLPLRENKNGIQVIRIPQDNLKTKKSVWNWVYTHFQIFFSADIIHAHDVFWWYLPLRLLLFWKPVYTTFHGYEGADAPTHKAIRSRKVSELFSWGVICIGAWMQRWYGTRTRFVSYGAADAGRSTLPEENTAVFIGRLDYDTGVLTYIEGIQKLRGKVKLDIFGEGPLLEELKQQIKNLPYISYEGMTKNPVAVLKNYRFACVSRYLGMIEAMQVGRHVFAQWNNRIKHDYLESFPAHQNATLFHDADEFAEGVQTIIKNTSLEKKHIERAYLWASKQRWSVDADLYEELWQTSR